MSIIDKIKEIGSRVVKKIDLKPGLQRIRDHLAKLPRFVPKPWKPTKPIQLAPAVGPVKLPTNLPVLKKPTPVKFVPGAVDLGKEKTQQLMDMFKNKH